MRDSSIWEFQPGQREYVYHFHHGSDEVLIVLRGEPTLRTKDGARKLREGVVVSLPHGPEGARAISNPSDSVVRILMFQASRPSADMGQGGRRTADGGPPSRFSAVPRATIWPMRLWRLTREAQTALNGVGAAKHGGRYSPAGVPVVSFASEAGLAVLVALRYLPSDPAAVPTDYVLGWKETEAVPQRAPDGSDEAIREWVTLWLDERRSLLGAVRSKVLPEADVVLMNVLHPAASAVPPLVTRQFSFAECLHRPPMLARYSGGADERP